MLWDPSPRWYTKSNFYQNVKTCFVYVFSQIKYSKVLLPVIELTFLSLSQGKKYQMLACFPGNNCTSPLQLGSAESEISGLGSARSGDSVLKDSGKAPGNHCNTCIKAVYRQGLTLESQIHPTYASLNCSRKFSAGLQRQALKGNVQIAT